MRNIATIKILSVLILIIGIILLSTSVETFIKINTDKYRAQVKVELESAFNVENREAIARDEFVDKFIEIANRKMLYTLIFSFMHIICGVGMLKLKKWSSITFIIFLIFLISYDLYPPAISFIKNESISWYTESLIFHIAYILVLLFVIIYLSRPQIKSLFTQ